MKTTNRIIKNLCGAVLSLVLVFGLAALASSTTSGATIADPAIAFISTSDAAGAFVSVMNADGSNVKKLIGNIISGTYSYPAKPNWSPDGQWITFEAYSQIYAISKDGGTPVLLAARPGLAHNPVWSPVGGLIAYSWAVGTSSSGSDVRVIPAGGGTAQVLYHFSYPLDMLDALSWSPDATHLAVNTFDYSLTTLRKSGLSIFDLGTGLVLDVTHPLGFDFVSNGGGYWARHSNWIAFTGAKVGEAAAQWILDLDLMEARKLDGLTDASTWSPDDTKLVFTKSGQLWTVNVATGAQALLAQPPVAKNAHFQESYSAPDWRRF
jgi:Tol biopolymer transport system component